MIKALIDPSVLVPPAQGSVIAWLSSLKSWSRTLRNLDSGAVAPIMSLEAQAALATLAGRPKIEAALAKAGWPLHASDVIQLIDSIRGRSSTPAEAFEPSDVIFKEVNATPRYHDSGDTNLIRTFVQDLGHSAAFQREENKSHVAVVTRGSSWEGPTDRVVVTGDVEAWERFGSLEELSGDKSSVSEALALWETPNAIDSTLEKCWSNLIEYPILGIELVYRTFSSADDEERFPLRLEIGPQLVETMRSMEYVGKAARIRGVAKAAAYVGCQRAGDLRSLKAHAYCKGGPGGPPVQREDGAKLLRGSLGTGPNANRLMWWDGQVPVILGVVGHDDDPRFLV